MSCFHIEYAIERREIELGRRPVSEVGVLASHIEATVQPGMLI